MICWNVTYHCKKGKREDFYRALCEMKVREESQKEKGNLWYDYFFAAAAPEDLFLVEAWADPATQQAHTQTKRFEKLQELKAQYCETVMIEKYER